MAHRRLAISIDNDIDGLLRDAARDHGTSDGMVVKALIRHGVGLIHAGDTATISAVRNEITADRQRRADVGRRVMEARYAATSPKDIDDDTTDQRPEGSLRGRDPND